MEGSHTPGYDELSEYKDTHRWGDRDRSLSFLSDKTKGLLDTHHPHPLPLVPPSPQALWRHPRCVRRVLLLVGRAGPGGVARVCMCVCVCVVGQAHGNTDARTAIHSPHVPHPTLLKQTGFVIGFRVNNAYQLYYEGRRIVGQIINAVREIVLESYTSLPKGTGAYDVYVNGGLRLSSGCCRAKWCPPTDRFGSPTHPPTNQHTTTTPQ